MKSFAYFTGLLSDFCFLLLPLRVIYEINTPISHIRSRGCDLGIIGRNGAGKGTLLKRSLVPYGRAGIKGSSFANLPAQVAQSIL